MSGYEIINNRTGTSKVGPVWYLAHAVQVCNIHSDASYKEDPRDVNQHVKTLRARAMDKQVIDSLLVLITFAAARPG